MSPFYSFSTITDVFYHYMLFFSSEFAKKIGSNSATNLSPKSPQYSQPLIPLLLPHFQSHHTKHSPYPAT